jgi:hypothetical protein
MVGLLQYDSILIHMDNQREQVPHQAFDPESLFTHSGGDA